MNIMNIVILDANFLLVSSQYQVDIYHEIRTRLTGVLRIILLPEVLEELQNKSNTTVSTKFRRNAKMAIELLKKHQEQNPNQFTEIAWNNTQNLPVDDYLISVAAQQKEKNSNNNVYIATNDKELRIKASNYGIGTIYMRQKKFLEISS